MKKMTLMIAAIIMLFILMISVSAIAESGTIYGVDWDLTDGVLTIGRDGETQVLDNTSYYVQTTSWPWWNKKDSITSIIVYDVEAHGSLYKIFDSCSKATVIDVQHLDVTYVTDIRDMFYGCSKVSVLDTSAWNTSSVKEMLGVFGGCSSLVEIVGISDWNTSSVRNSIIPDRRPNSVFFGCEQLTSLDLSRWDTSQMQNFVYMFQQCRNLTSLNISGWDTSSAIDFDQMFYGCTKLANIDVSSFVTSGVTNMKGMFAECASLADIDVSGFDTSHVTSMSSMFKGCSSLTSLDLSNFVTDSVESFADMFYGCSGITSFDDIVNWNTSNVTSFGGMFHDCAALTHLDVTHFDTSQSLSFRYMFAGCSQLQSLDVSHFDTSKATAMDSMFSKCSQIIELDVSGFDTSNVTNMMEMFFECSNLVTVDVSGWDLSKVTTFTRMFYKCWKLENLDVSNWDVSQCSSGYGVFAWCNTLKTLDVSHWNVSNFWTTELMFTGCSALETLDVSEWDVHNIQKFRQMFSSCSKLKVIDVSHWNIANAADLGWMFSSCYDLEVLDLSNWDPRNVTLYTEPFQVCSSLNTVFLGDINPFIGKTVENYALLPTPPSSKDGIAYTGKWIREDGTAGPYTPKELRDNYTSAMAGKWVWEKVPTEYTITFVCTEDGYLGDMPPVTVEAAEDYTLPGNAFRVFGYVFDHWTDGARRVWEDKAVIPANTYAAGAELTFTAVFTPRDTSIVMQDGAFDFSIKADEKALFSPILASTAYQVYEQTPFGWNLIAQTDASGIIMPDQESEALFLNQYDPLKVTVRFAGTKLMDGSAAEVDSFNFLLYEDDTLVDIASVSDGGLIEFQPITYEQAGVHHYYIREAIGNDATVSYDTHVEEITVEITSDGVGHLYADVAMDEDEILFENASKPGYLVLSKANAAADSRTGTFLYEVQFTTENGQPYELFSGDITYEERDEEISELPIGQVVEKPKYKLTVEHYMRDANLVESLYSTQNSYYTAGEIVSINTITDGSLSSYRIKDVDQGAVRASDGCYKLLMPSSDITVKAVYTPVTTKRYKLRWAGYDPDQTAATIDLFANDELVASKVIYRNSSEYMGTDTYAEFTELPVYDDAGHLIEYTGDVEIPEGYYLVLKSTMEAQIQFGFQTHVFWDDNDDYYGFRPDEFMFDLRSSNGNGWLCSVFASNNWIYSNVYSESSPGTDTYTITGMTNPYWKAFGYTLINSATDPTLEEHDIRLVLTSVPIKGTITWDDADNSAGSRPSSVMIKVMNGDNVVASKRVYSSDSWTYRFELPLPEDWGPIEYSIAIDDVDNYSFSVDGYDIVGTYTPTVDITITDVTLLSAEEYNTYKSNIPLNSTGWWWLRSPNRQYYADSVLDDGTVRNGSSVQDNNNVRPVLRCDLSSSNLSIGDKISLANHTWTVISDTLILCDDFIGRTAFRTNWQASDANVYAASEVKIWLENWAMEKGIMPEPEFEITDVTLLGSEEYTEYQSNIPLNSNGWWWLRSPGSVGYYAATIGMDGSLGEGHVGNATGCVRFAIMYNPDSYDFNIGDNISLWGYNWTVVGDGIILLDALISPGIAFRTDYNATNANDYNESDIKVYVDDWASEHIFWTKIVTATLVN